MFLVGLCGTEQGWQTPLETPGKEGLVVTLDAVPGVEIWLVGGGGHTLS